MIQYSRNSWHSRLFENAYPFTRLPDNICSYFWLLLLAIVTLPITFIGRILNIFNLNFSFLLQVLIQGAMGVTLLLCSTIGQKLIDSTTIINLLVGFGVILLSAIATMSFIFLIGAIGMLIDKFLSKKKKFNNPLVEGFKAWKGKYCSKIDWYEDRNN